MHVCCAVLHSRVCLLLNQTEPQAKPVSCPDHADPVNPLTFWCDLVPADLVNIVCGEHVVAARHGGQLHAKQKGRQAGRQAAQRVEELVVVSMSGGGGGGGEHHTACREHSCALQYCKDTEASRIGLVRHRIAASIRVPSQLCNLAPSAGSYTAVWKLQLPTPSLRSLLDTDCNTHLARCTMPEKSSAPATCRAAWNGVPTADGLSASHLAAQHVSWCVCCLCHCCWHVHGGVLGDVQALLDQAHHVTQPGSRQAGRFEAGRQAARQVARFQAGRFEGRGAYNRG